MKLTINEIAELSQVSKSTVSKALNGKKGVSEEKRERIVKIAEQLDYHPNASARALASNRSLAIGLMLPCHAGSLMSGAYWSTMVATIAEEASLRGYSLLVLSPSPEVGDYGAFVESFVKRRNVDGLIVSAERLDPKIVSTLALAELPFVIIGSSPGVRHYSIDVDNEAASRKVVAHLVAKGRRRIACLAGPAGLPYVIERIEGYRSALREAGLSWSAVEHSAYDPEDAKAAIERLLEGHPDADALFFTAGGDFVLDAIDALGRLKFDLSEFGLSVFDDYRFFDRLGLPVSRLRQPLREIGLKAASLLFELIGGGVPERKEWILETQAILR
jgi:DNA-binding LacI/PurR family transcriptional regulator